MFKSPSLVKVVARFKLLRPMPKRPLEGVLVSEEPVVSTEHFHDGRTVPCLETDKCEACRSGHVARTTCYAYFFSFEKDRIDIVALPFSGVIAFKQAHEKFGPNLKGRGCRILRAGHTKRSAVRIQWATDEPDNRWKAIQLPPLEAVLVKIWGISSLVFTQDTLFDGVDPTVI